VQNAKSKATILSDLEDSSARSSETPVNSDRTAWWNIPKVGALQREAIQWTLQAPVARNERQVLHEVEQICCLSAINLTLNDILLRGFC
jgi:hypothetical protein